MYDEKFQQNKSRQIKSKQGEEKKNHIQMAKNKNDWKIQLFSTVYRGETKLLQHGLFLTSVFSK